MNQLVRTLTEIEDCPGCTMDGCYARHDLDRLAAGERTAELSETRWSSPAWKTLVEVAGA